MAGAEVFSLCSREEPQGIVVLEAMAVGTPVVASDVGGVTEVIDGKNGLLVPASDHLALADALRSLLNGSVSRDDLRAAARSTVSRFSWSTVADGYDRAYADAGA
jgi:glycosyltransferase involved in cell wall biosynthesis